MKISIIIPTYNEEQDIRGTLNSLCALDYDDKEIIVVDDSTDCTPTIVKSFAKNGVKLIRPGGGGRCEARNKGIWEANGEIVCILNADVRPAPDFLQRIERHYNNGADYVLVDSHVSNQNDLFARYIECRGKIRSKRRKDPNWPEWTEGFSCRRDLAMKIGGFPVGYPIPISAGEDGYFGSKLRKSGAKKIVDFTIIVEHVAPSSLKEYWYIRKGRGAGSVQVHRYLDKWSYLRILLWNMLKTIKTILFFITLIPALYICWQASIFSYKKHTDILPFFYAWFIENVAFHVGEWQAIIEVMEKENNVNKR